MTKRAAGRIGRQCPRCGNGTAGMGGGNRYCTCGWSNKPKELPKTVDMSDADMVVKPVTPEQAPVPSP